MILRLRNVLINRGWSFRFGEIVKPTGAFRPGDPVLFQAEVGNNGLRLGTVYPIVQVASAYNHHELVFDSDRDLPETERHALRLVDIRPSSSMWFAITWHPPEDLAPGVYDVRFVLWSPPKLFRKTTWLDYPFEYSRTKWRGWLDFVPSLPTPTSLRVFISYSWSTDENPEHHRWVRMFADELTRYDMEVVLDVRRFPPGEELRKLVDLEKTRCHAIVMVCSGAYVKKANDLTGGVGIETAAFSEEPFFSANREKIIPIVIDNDFSPPDRVPRYLKGILWLDFTIPGRWRAEPMTNLVARIRSLAILANQQRE